MINFQALFIALTTCQYDHYTVQEFKAQFDTEPGNTTFEELPTGPSKRMGMSIMAHHLESLSENGCVIVVGGHNPGEKPFSDKPNNPFPIRDLKIEPICERAQIFDNPKRIREERKQNQFRSRNHKK